MFALKTRIHTYSSVHRITRFLLASSISSSNSIFRYFQLTETSEEHVKHLPVNVYLWKLTHQPHEPKLHWNSRFRLQQQHQQTVHAFIVDDDSFADDWDSWIEDNQLRVHSPSNRESDSLLLNYEYSPVLPSLMSMPKRAPDASLSFSLPAKSGKHDTYDHGNSFGSVPSTSTFDECFLDEWNLPRRHWSTVYDKQRLVNSHHEHFQFHLISYNILAQSLIDANRCLYDDCSSIHLDWHRRKKRLFKEILRQDADVCSTNVHERFDTILCEHLDCLSTRNAKRSLSI
jgi:hypothetical protein